MSLILERVLAVQGGTWVSAIVVTLTVYYLVHLLQFTPLFRSKSDPPLVFHWLPIVGSAITYGLAPYEFFEDCQRRYGNLFTFVLLGRRMTVALGPKGNATVLNGKLSHLNAEEAYTHLTTPVFGTEVVYDVPNEVFMTQKKFVKFGLSVETFRAHVPMIVDEVTNYLRESPRFSSLKSTGSAAVDATDVFGEITILTAAATLQGKEVRSQLDASFAKLYHDLDEGFTPINFLFPNLPLPSYKRRDVAQRKMAQLYLDILKKRRETGAVDEHDMIQNLTESTYKDGRPLRDKEIAHIMIALLMAGQHTSSSTAAWTMLHLANDPETYNALWAEQLRVFGDGREDVKAEDLLPLEYEKVKSDCPLLNAAIKETLRIHPPIHSIMRKVIKDLPIPSSSMANVKRDFVVPKGHYVMAAPGVSAIDPEIWERPREWDPKRWLDGQATLVNKDEDDGEKVDYGWGAVSSGAGSPFLPFGAGRHRCIGEQFAYNQLGAIVATFVRTFGKLSLENGMPLPNYETMMVQPKQPCKIRFERR